MRKITLAVLALTLTTLACATPRATPIIERETIILGTTNSPAPASRVDEAGEPDPVPAPVATFDTAVPAMEWLASNELNPDQYIVVTTHGADQAAALRTMIRAGTLRRFPRTHFVIPAGVRMCLSPQGPTCVPAPVPLLVVPTGDRAIRADGSNWDVRVQVQVVGLADGEVLGGSISPMAWPVPTEGFYYRWVSIRELDNCECEFAGEFAWSRIIGQAMENSDESEQAAIRQTIVVVGAAVLISAIPVPSPDDVLWLALAGAAVVP